MHQENRRSFVKKSLATSMTFTFSGLIRAHGGEGEQTTIANPDETTFETTDSGGTTTWNPDKETTVVTTSPEETPTGDPDAATTWNPDETTGEETTVETIEKYDINSVDFQAPTGTNLSYSSSGYAESGPAGTFIPIVALSANSSWNGFYKLKSTMSPHSLTPHPNTVTVTLEVEIWIYNGVSSFPTKSHEYTIECACDSLNGNLTPTPNWNLNPNSAYNWSEIVNGIPVMCEVIAKIGPIQLSGSGSNIVTITGDFGITLKKNGVDTNVNPKKTFKLEFKSHKH